MRKILLSLLFSILAVPSLAVELSDKNLGRTVMLNGDTPWCLIAGWDRSEITTYLDTRQAQGFNALQFELVENAYCGPETPDGLAPFVPAGDFASPNEAYFQRADWVIDEAVRRGFVLFINPVHIDNQVA